MTMRELMSPHRGIRCARGAGYKVNIADRDKPLQAMIDKLAAIPLAAQPGTDWRYGHSVNIQGYIVEKLSGMPLDEFLAANLQSFEDERHRILGGAVETRPRVAAAHAAGQTDHERAAWRHIDEAGVPVGKRRATLDGRGLLAVFADAAQRRTA